MEWTADSSPTLRLNGVHPLDSTKRNESMHHSGGAATETLYIYGEAIGWVLKNSGCRELQICSVGLGLGYNEILTAILIMQDSTKTARLDSFEIDSELKDSFIDWVFDSPLKKPELSEKNLIYDQIFEKLCRGLELTVRKSKLKKYLQTQIQSGQWHLHNELSLEKVPVLAKYHLCLFDAFSQKTTKELWDEQFLNQFFQKNFDSSYAALATYACTGVLTRALKNNGFSVFKKPGFLGKRDSTWAERKPQGEESTQLITS